MQISAAVLVPSLKSLKFIEFHTPSSSYLQGLRLPRDILHAQGKLCISQHKLQLSMTKPANVPFDVFVAINALFQVSSAKSNNYQQKEMND